ncbi:MAG TPA: GspE/PulE family protein [Chthoniobacterales bacterium]|jgi:type IV pilus assembly protein PilB
MNAKLVTDMLVENGVMTRVQVEDILQEAGHSGKPIEQVLVDFGYYENTAAFLMKVAENLGTEYYDLNDVVIPHETLRLIPAGLARLHGALPLGEQDGSILIALSDPLNGDTVEELRFAASRDIRVVVADPIRVDELILSSYGSDSASMSDIMASFGGEELQLLESVGAGGGEAEANATPIIKFVDLILYQAIQDRASDIHFEPFEYEFKIRYRVDGALYEMAPPPRHLALPVISRLKVLANLNIAERRLPQDGRIQKTIAGRAVDMRVSTLPTQFGESVVLRVLDRSSVNLDLETLGMPEPLYQYILNTIEKPNGIFIVTGPTGSGKTTTLYSCLRRINTIDSKLLTAEDPVEYDMEGIMQVPVNEGIGLNFARVLRAFLRQDPDRIMVGETRDLETAQISIQASLTGHLVLTTLHTNDAPGAVARLIDMGVEPFLISAALEGVLAQRLIRKICPQCRTPYEPSEALLAQLGLSPHEIGDKNFYYGKGCDFCNNTGYKGRKGIYELLDVTDPIREMINQRAPSLVLRQKAIELGMVTLREDGLRSIFDGETTIEEVVKYT